MMSKLSTYLFFAIVAWTNSDGKVVFSNRSQSGDNPETHSCSCVPYYLCNRTLNTNEEVFIDIGISSDCCHHYLDVCCNKNSQTETPITPTPRVDRPGCGWRNPQGIGFQITGDKDNETQYAEFPWMVAVLREVLIDPKSKPVTEYQCGGALIHPQVVLTAAYCVKSRYQTFAIRAGEWDYQTKTEPYPHQDREVETIVRHPQFQEGSHWNDIALLFLKSPVDMAENVNVVCLPKQNVNVDPARCYATGWGDDIFVKEGLDQMILKKMDFPIVSREYCLNKLRAYTLGRISQLHPSLVCAGGEKGKDMCKADRGSPLMCPIPGETDRYQQVGIMCRKYLCGVNGEHDYPGVYANVGLFRNWIDQQLKAKGLDTDSYNL